VTPVRADTASATPVRVWRAPHRVALRILGRATVSFVEDHGTHLSAAISYYGLFALFPVTLLGASVFGIVLRSSSVRERVLQQLFTQLPLNPDNTDTVREALANAATLGPTLSVVSLVGALWTAGALAAAIRSALNVIFKSQRGRPMLRGKLIDYVLLPIIGLPFVGGLVLTTAWRLAQLRVEELPVVLARTSWLWELGAFLIPLALSFAAFLLLYWQIPNREVRVRDAWPGALIAALLFEGLKVGFAFYLANVAAFDLVYGPLSSVIVLMFWVYLTANITLFGAEIASEVPYVLRDQGRQGRANGEDVGDWRRSLWSFARGLVLAGDDDGHPVGEDRQLSRPAPPDPGSLPRPAPAGRRVADATGSRRPGGVEPAAAVDVRALRVVRGGQVVLGDLALRIPHGRVTGLLGPSGCGKTTLMRAIVGVQTVAAGTVDVLGLPAGAAPLRSRVGYLTQAPSVYRDLTVRENLDYFAHVLGVGRDAIDATLDVVGLSGEASRITGRLSGGQLARVSLATVLLGDPELLVLDEPTVGLDPLLREELWSTFHALAARGATLLVSTHVMDEAERCDEVLLMRDGAVLAQDTPAGLLARTGAGDIEGAFLALVRHGAAGEQRS